MPPRLSRGSNYVQLLPFWSPFKIRCFSSLNRRDGNSGGISLMLLFLFWGNVGPGICRTPVSQLVCRTIGLTFTLSWLSQGFPRGQGDGRNRSRGFFFSHHTRFTCGKKSVLSQSSEICLSAILGRQDYKYISLIFIVRLFFIECAAYCDISSIVLKWSRSFEVFKDPTSPQAFCRNIS